MKTGTDNVTASPPAAEPDVTIVTVMKIGSRFVGHYRKTLVRAGVIFLVLGIAVALIIPATYTARATILPPESNGGALSSLMAALPMAAAQMLGGSGDSKMVELYVDIAQSQSILSAVLDADYQGHPFRRALCGSGDDPDWQLMENIRESFAGSKNPRTQLVMFELSNHDPQLASGLLNEILRQMDSFFRYRVATNENVQRKLIESRLSEVSDSLKLSEDMLRQFKESNRTTFRSPKLMLEEGRLMREVEINNVLYVELTKQLEFARISEAETMPILNVLDYPVPPERKSGPSRALIVALMLCIGLTMTTLYICFRSLAPSRARRLADRVLNWQYEANV
jgi:uncharacterized protein involved in exopolysaccharide biosynthesis